MNYKELQELAISEAKALRRYTTPQQKASLSLDLFDPRDGEYCIYGQLTGDCDSIEATELAKKCAKGLFSNSLSLIGKNEYYLESHYAPHAKIRGTEYFTPLEVYIYNRNADAKRILRYIKGDTDELNLTEVARY